MRVLLVSLLFVCSMAQPDGTPRLSGAGYVTTDCKNLRLGEEPPFPNNYVDELNNYIFPNVRLLQSQRDTAGNYKRTFHFPTTGCAQATFDVLPDLPLELQQGIFRPGASYPAFLRFSGFDQATQNSTDTRGFAVKLYNVKGRKLLPGFEDDDHFDIVNNAFPQFQFNNETVFASGIMSRTQLCGGGDKCRALHSAAYPLNAAISAAEKINNTVGSQLTMPYFAISPFKFGLQFPAPAVKYRWFPCVYEASIPSIANQPSNFLTVDMTNRLANSSYCFRFQIQFQKDPCIQPINDFSVEWLEADTPYIDAAILNIPSQQVLNDSDYTCKNIAFNAWRVTEEHRPLGSLNRARLFAMMNSQNQRFSLDTLVEPVTGKRHPGFQFYTPNELGINEKFVPAKLKVNFPGNVVPLNPDNGVQTGYGENRVAPLEDNTTKLILAGAAGSALTLACVGFVGFMFMIFRSRSEENRPLLR